MTLWPGFTTGGRISRVKNAAERRVAADRVVEAVDRQPAAGHAPALARTLRGFGELEVLARMGVDVLGQPAVGQDAALVVHRLDRGRVVERVLGRRVVGAC